MQKCKTQRVCNHYAGLECGTKNQQPTCRPSILDAQLSQVYGYRIDDSLTAVPNLQIMSCRSERAKDGRFDENPDGPEWIASEEVHDWVFWQPLTGEIATDTGRAFALGEELIDNPATTAFDQQLNIYADPLQWLKNEGRGIVVVNWKFAFDRLRDVTRVAVAEELLGTYKRCMRPLHMPKLFVLPNLGGLVS